MTAGARGLKKVAESCVVRLENVGKRYGTDAEILRDVSMQLDPGGFYFLTGASGAGKTTLLKIIYLAEPPVARHLLVCSAPISPRPIARPIARCAGGIGIVFQDFRLVDAFERPRQRRPAAAHRRRAGARDPRKRP